MEIMHGNNTAGRDVSMFDVSMFRRFRLKWGVSQSLTCALCGQASAIGEEMGDPKERFRGMMPWFVAAAQSLMSLRSCMSGKGVWWD